MSDPTRMTAQDVDVRTLETAIRDAGKPVHVDVLARCAAAVWLTVHRPRRYAPGATYSEDETLLFDGRSASVQSVSRQSNPSQGAFSVLTLQLSKDETIRVAAEVVGALAQDAEAQQYEVEGVSLNSASVRHVRSVVQEALRASPRFVSFEDTLGNHWCMVDLLRELGEPELARAIAALPKECQDGDLVSVSTEELVTAVWGCVDDGSPEYMLRTVALAGALDACERVVDLSGRWALREAWNAVCERLPLAGPGSWPTGIHVPCDIKLVDDLQAADDVSEQEDREPEGPGEQTAGKAPDVESWRDDHPSHAVLTLHARHYYEGWLPLTRDVRSVFPPFACGKQEVKFHHHFGDRPNAFPAWVDHKAGRVWVSQQMYETLQNAGIYPGAKLDVSAINEREFELSTRKPQSTEPILVGHIWREGDRIEYEEYPEPRRYDIDADVFVADVRYEDLAALRRQAELAGNSIFGLMYNTACRWRAQMGNHQVSFTLDKMFDAILRDPEKRATSKATIAWELWRRMAFVRQKGGAYLFRPEYGERLRGVDAKGSGTDAPSPPTPDNALWRDIMALQGRELTTLDEQRPFVVQRVAARQVHLLLRSTGEKRTVPRKEIELAWQHLLRQGTLSRTGIHKLYSEFNPPYVAALLAAMPGVSSKTRPIRLTYARPGLEPTQPHELPHAPGRSQPPPPADLPVWDRLAELRGKPLRTLDKDRPFRVRDLTDDHLFVVPSSTGHERSIPRQEIETAWDHLVSKGRLSLAEIRDLGYSERSPAYIAALFAALKDSVRRELKPVRLFYRLSSVATSEPQPSDAGQADMVVRGEEPGADPKPMDGMSSGPPPLPATPPPSLPPAPQPSAGALRDLREAARAIARQATEVQLDERELVTLFFQEGFFAALGYGKVGDDVRLEQRVQHGRTDVVLRSFTGRPVALLEFKRPRLGLQDHVEQLQGYAKDLMPAVAILTNGLDFWLFRLEQERLQQPAQQYVLSHLSPSEATEVYQRLYRRQVDWRRLNEVRDVLARCRAEAVRVTSPAESGGRQFLQRFALDARSPFGRLTQALAEALPHLVLRSQFARGAYDFWRQAYARDLDLDDAPASWRPLIARSGREALYQFMFALETAYALLSRAMLAKAMTDAHFPQLDALAALERRLQDLQRQEALAYTDYLVAVQAVFEQAARQAFASLFASDIFDWWSDAAQLADPSDLCEGLAEAVIAVFDFDYVGLAGDVLGTLYQSYFDAETRKALGEFYTPPEVVDFILDQVGYRGLKVATQRLLDPACGSGTFLVHALRRYLDAQTGRDPAATLRSLVEGLSIVGFDVNPFAVLMSQANYAAQILPLYAQAVHREPGFALRSVPVFRTDSLRKELQEGEAEEVKHETDTSEVQQLGFTLTYEGGISRIHTVLPVRIAEGRFLEVDVPVPGYSQARCADLVDSIEQYFVVLQDTFVAIREGAVGQEALERRFAANNLIHARALASYVSPAATQIGRTLERLRTEYQDGRFLKTIEDLVLALLLKNDFQFDYVVGNPPYVRIQNIPPLLRKYWSGKYAWAEGNFDIYIPFFERAVMEWLREGGRLGYICSNRFLLANYAQTLRSQLPDSAEVELIADLRDTRVFKDALNYPAIIVLRRVNPQTRQDLSVARAFADPGEGASVLLAEVRELLHCVQTGQRYARGSYADAFLAPGQCLEPEAWLLMPERERRVFQMLASAGTHRLEELTLTRSGGFQGWSTSADDILVLRLVRNDGGDKLVLEPKGGGPPVTIERAVLRPWLFGRDVERWHVAWDGWYVLFPYARIEGHYHLMPTIDNRNKLDYASLAAYAGPFLDRGYPLAWRYLRHHENELRQRERGRFRHGSSEEHLWYGATYPRSLDIYEATKILIQVSSTTPDLALDERGEFVFTAGGTSGVYGVVLGQEISPDLALALMNSPPLDFYLKHVSTVYSGHAYSYGDQFIKNLPIRLPRERHEVGVGERLSRLARRLTQAKGMLRAAERDCRAFPDPLLVRLQGCELYPLRRLTSGPPLSAAVRPAEARFEAQLDGQWAMSCGRSTLFLPSEAHKRLVETWLGLQGRASVRSEDLLAMRVPATAEACACLLDLLLTEQQDIERLKSVLSDGEEELNRLVAQLYGLGRPAMRVIKEFLERF